MSFDSIPHLSLGMAAIIIFAVCFALVLLRGIGRMLRGTIILAASGWAGLTTWHLAPEVSHQWFGKSQTLLLIALPLIAFAAVFWLLHKAFQFVLLPFESLGSDDRPKPSLASGLIFAAFPAAILFLISASLFHHFGAIEEIRAFASAPDSEKPNRARVFVRNFKSSLDRILPDSILRMLDPATDPARLKAAKLVTRRSQQTPEPVIDPSTGLPYPRAIIVDDPELQTLAREGKFGTLLRHPILTKATQDPTVQKLLSHFHSQ